MESDRSQTTEIYRNYEITSSAVGWFVVLPDEDGAILRPSRDEAHAAVDQRILESMRGK